MDGSSIIIPDSESVSEGSSYPEWIYDGSVIPDPLGCGERAVKFLRLLRHPNSTADGKAFQLHPFQERIVRRIYGPRHDDGRRIVQNVFLLVPRGNRKTSLAAALALLHTIGPERVPSGQVIFAAADREQASIGFTEAANIIREDKRLVKATKIYDAFNSAKQIVFKQDNVTLRAISSDGKAAHGMTPNFTLIDELHVWKGRDLWEALSSGSSKVDDSLTIIATTAGRGAETLSGEQFNYATEVAKGEIQNPAYLPILFGAAATDHWQDEELWHRVNPGLQHGFPSLNGLRTLAKEAEHRPSDKYAFLQFNLNIWQANSRDPLFSMQTYDSRKFDDDPETLEDFPCWLGVDLSVNGDTSCVVAAWLHDDGQITIKPTFFIPGDGIQERAETDGVPYELWRDQRHVIATPGPIIDPDFVEDHIREHCATHDVQEIAFDPYLARKMMQTLYDEGLPVVEFRQAPLSMSVAIGDLEKAVNGKFIRHDGHPVLRHHFDCVVASRNETSGLVRMHKGKKTDRIDGAVAAAMAVHRASQGETNRSQYSGEDAEIFVF
ncbi:terminase large subunit [Tateyamaria sp. SN3-11]|uniref:terminase large subunit n=1 Tax=Tateyamaria sp. SN3-11 TaxID=3092147 RepID=UPI0039E7D9E0